MTYPSSSPIRRSARGTRGFQPGFEPPAPEPFVPDTTAKGPPPRPANSPYAPGKLERYVARGKWLARATGVAIATEIGWAIGNQAYEWWFRKTYGDPGARPAPPITEWYRQSNPRNVPTPYYGNGPILHSWTCPTTGDFSWGLFWTPTWSWNDTLKCLTAQAQFPQTYSVRLPPHSGTGFEYVADGGALWQAGAPGGAVIHWNLWGWYPISGGATSRSHQLAHIAFPGAGTTGAIVRAYAGSPWWFPAVQPAISPSINPHALPINVPVTTPRPVAYGAVPYMPVADPFAPGTTPLRGPAPARAISPSPWQNGIVVTPGQPVKPAPPHVRRPPVRGECERKPARDVKRAIDRIVGPVTEAVDAIDAVYDALPWKVRMAEYRKCKASGMGGRECLTPQRKLQIVYDNYESLDMVEVIKNLAKNAAEDRIIGELSRRADKNLRRRGWHDIFNRGPTSGPAI